MTLTVSQVKKNHSDEYAWTVSHHQRESSSLEGRGVINLSTNIEEKRFRKVSPPLWGAFTNEDERYVA